MQLTSKHKKIILIFAISIFVILIIISIEILRKNKIEKFNSMNLEISKKIDGLNEENSKYKLSIDTLNEENNKFKTNINNLSEENSKLKIKVSELTKNISNLNNKISNLTKTPEQRFSEALNLIKNNKNSEGEQILRDIIIKYPDNRFSKESYNKVRNIYLSNLNNLKNKINLSMSKSELIQIESELNVLNLNYLEFDKGDFNSLLKTCKYKIQNFDKVSRTSYLKNCKRYKYKKLERDADELKGSKILFYGKVFTVQKNNGVMQLQVNFTENDYGHWTDQVMVSFDSITNVYKGDYIAVAGTIEGKYTYTSEANWNITVPLVNAKYIFHSNKE